MDNIEKFIPLNPKLRPYIQSYLFPVIDYEKSLKKKNGELELLPSPTTSMIFFFSDPSFIKETSHIEKYDEFVFTGYYSCPKKIMRTTSLDQMIITFSPAGIQHLLSFKISEIMNSFISIKDIFKDDFQNLSFQLRSASSNIQRIRVFENYMIEKISKSGGIDDRAFSLLKNIQKSNGHYGIKQISKAVGIGERTIQRIVHKYMGINYKTLSKLIRFQKAKQQLSDNNGMRKMGDLAYELHYFDQAHFIHDFKSLSGLTPSQFLKKQSQNNLFDIPGRI